MVLEWKHSFSIATRDQTILNKWEKGGITTQKCMETLAKHNEWDMSKITTEDFFDTIKLLGWGTVYVQRTRGKQ